MTDTPTVKITETCGCGGSIAVESDNPLPVVTAWRDAHRCNGSPGRRDITGSTTAGTAFGFTPRIRRTAEVLCVGGMTHGHVPWHPCGNEYPDCLWPD